MTWHGKSAWHIQSARELYFRTCAICRDNFVFPRDNFVIFHENFIVLHELFVVFRIGLFRPETSKRSLEAANIGLMTISTSLFCNFLEGILPSRPRPSPCNWGYQHSPRILFCKTRHGGGVDSGSFLVVFRVTTMYAGSLATSLDAN